MTDPSEFSDPLEVPEPTSADAVETIPLFPLPQVVLFPGALLPLHIFEPRYREMMESVLDRRGWIGMALLKPGWEREYYGSPPLFETLGVGEIVKHEKTDDGRFYLMLMGLSRGRIVEELDGKPYREARVRMLRDEKDLSDATCDRILPALRGILQAVKDKIDWRLFPVPVDAPPSEIATMFINALCTACVSDPYVRQTLLEKETLSSRLDLLLEQGGWDELEEAYRES